VTFKFLRTLFILLCMVLGYQLGRGYDFAWPYAGIAGAGAGVLLATLIVLVEYALGKVSLRGLSAAVFGLLLALFISRFLTGAIDLIHMDPGYASTLKLVLVVILSYLGMIFSMRGRDEFNLIVPYVKFERQDQKDAVMILDTSAIIDGRIFDICQTKFIEGRFIIPRFVLKELQQLSDSQDSLKRNRGRRGLDILNKLKAANVPFKIHDEDVVEAHGVDEKLVALAKVLGAKIMTNDFNLNKIAEIQGVSILNINDLAAALRPVVLPGETMDVRLIKEGKEHNQAIGYLDDGTMVVVDNAKRQVGNNQRVLVTSVLQTAAGRMIFAKLETDRANSGPTA